MLTWQYKKQQSWYDVISDRMVDIYVAITLTNMLHGLLGVFVLVHHYEDRNKYDDLWKYLAIVTCLDIMHNILTITAKMVQKTKITCGNFDNENMLTIMLILNVCFQIFITLVSFTMGTILLYKITNRQDMLYMSQYYDLYYYCKFTYWYAIFEVFYLVACIMLAAFFTFCHKQQNRFEV
jgi:hypothetical protein